MMSTFSKIIYTFFFLLFFVNISIRILYFFDVGVDKYGPILLWVIGLTIFIAVLPSRPYVFD